MNPGTIVICFASKVCVALADERLRFCCAPYVDEPSTLDRKGLGLRHAGIDGVDLGIENDEIGVTRIGVRALCFSECVPAEKAACGQAGQTQEFPTTVTVFAHRFSSPSAMLRRCYVNQRQPPSCLLMCTSLSTFAESNSSAT